VTRFKKGKLRGRSITHIPIENYLIKLHIGVITTLLAEAGAVSNDTSNYFDSFFFIKHRLSVLLFIF